jgi:hypothetical protein
MPGAKVKGGYTMDVVVTTGRTYHLQATTIEDQVATPLHHVRTVSVSLTSWRWMCSCTTDAMDERHPGLAEPPLQRSQQQEQRRYRSQHVSAYNQRSQFKQANTAVAIGDALTDNMGLPINSSMKTKEKVAALESYIQDLEVGADPILPVMATRSPLTMAMAMITHRAR